MKKGFTIIELMISTAVFGTVLMLCVSAFLNIGRLYYKGITTAKTQETARKISDEIGRSIQFSRESVNSSTGAICIGLTKYSYVTTKQITASVVDASKQTKNALWRDVGAAGACTSSTYDPNASPTKPASVELLSEGMRLNELKLTDKGDGLWELQVEVSSGDPDLFVGDGTAGYTKCKESGYKGAQFCAATSYTTSVFRRLN
jgi:prepilin-type N-terminal cleavage/methylation domain-containing protein